MLVKRLIVGLMAGLAMMMPGQAVSGGQLSIYVIDVGQGDSTLIVGPTVAGRRLSMLIDAGDNRSGVNGAAIVSKVLSSVGLARLDYVVLSHYDADHMGGFVTLGTGKQSLLWDRDGSLSSPTCKGKPLFPRLGIYDIGLPVIKKSKWSKSRQEWVACVPQLTGTGKAKHVQLDAPSKLGQTVDLGGGYKAKFVTGRGFVLGSTEKVDRANSPNEMSISVLVSGPKGFDFLVTGDLIGRRTNDKEDAKLELALGKVLSGRRIDVEVLRVGHHGAENASDPKFLKLIKPELALISVGNANQQKSGWDHPRCNSLRALSAGGVKHVIQTEPGLTKCDDGKPKPSKPLVARGSVLITVHDGNYTVSSYGRTSPITTHPTTAFNLRCDQRSGCAD